MRAIAGFSSPRLSIVLASLWIGLLLLPMGCGTKSVLRVRERRVRDAAVSDGAQPDAGRFDAGPNDGGGVDAAMFDAFVPPADLLVACGRSMRRGIPGRPVRLRAVVDGGTAPVSTTWEVRSAAGDLVGGAMSEDLEFVPASPGAYVARFEARDALGLVNGCEVAIDVSIDAVVAQCPDELSHVLEIGESVTLDGDPINATSARWTLDSGTGVVSVTPQTMDGTVVDVTALARGRAELTFVASGAGGEDGCTVFVRVVGPPSVTCPPPIRTTTRSTVQVVATAEDDDLASVRWSFVSLPGDSRATLTPEDSAVTNLAVDRPGEYQLSFVATDREGRTASCTTSVFAEPTPPTATCDDIVTRPLTSTMVTARADDDGMITSYAWTFVSGPQGTTSRALSPANQPNTSFTPDIAGIYVFELTVVDDTGRSASCRSTIRAEATEGLRMEVIWNTDRTDMDSHMLPPTGMQWFSDEDCYYANCRSGRPWGGAGEEDNPFLDIDDVDGFGPENINIMRPVDGTYRIAIDAFSGAAEVTVRIYCGGSTVEPRQVFGPVLITSARNDLWRVADVTITGTSCTITDLSSDGEPNIVDCSGCSR